MNQGCRHFVLVLVQSLDTCVLSRKPQNFPGPLILIHKMKESFLSFLSCLPALSEVLHLSDAKIPSFSLISFGFVLGTLLLWQIFVI